MCRVNIIKAGIKMSRNRQRVENPTERVTNSAVVDIIGGAPNCYPETVENHTRQIEYLKKEIEERNKTLSRLKQDFNDLRDQNDDLQITLESKNHEIEALKDKVYKIEIKKKNLEAKISLESKDKEITAVKKEVKDLRDQNDEKNKEIAALKISSESKDKEITAVKREVKDLKDQNDERAKEIKDLTISLESKDKEIIALRREVVYLKDQNEKLKISLEDSDKERDDLRDTIRELQNELKSLKLSTEALNKEWEDAKEERKKSEEDNNKLKLKVQKLSKTIDRMTTERNQKEEEDNKREKADRFENAHIVLGEMCSQLQAIMYRIVLPDSYREEYSYKVKSIEEDIKRKEGDRKRLANEKLDKLKRDISWDEINHPRTMKEIQRKRNLVAHPSKLTKDSLLRAANVMQEERKLKGKPILSHVHEIINIWDRLTQMK